MEYLKFFLFFLLTMTSIMMTCSAPKRKDDAIHFQESSETDIDTRPGNGHGNRNNPGRGKGRGRGHIQVPEFEQGIPGVYPIRGPPQMPFILPDQKSSTVNTEKPVVSSTPNLIYITAKSTTNGDQYANNPYLKNEQTSTKGAPVFTVGVAKQLATTTIAPAYQNPNNPYLKNEQTSTKGAPVFTVGVAKQLPTSYQNPNNPYLKNEQTSTKGAPVFTVGVTNQLPTSDKMTTTIAPADQNPRGTDISYGIHVLEEGQSNRDGKATDTDDVKFDDRGLFDTAPHCQNGQILVHTRCRTQV